MLVVTLSEFQPTKYMWFQLTFCFITVFLLSACTGLGRNVSYAAQDIIDMQTESSGVYTVRLGRWTTDVPADTKLEIDVKRDYQVNLVTGDTRLNLGKLQQQLPDTPAKTMFLDTGTSRFILGWVDDTVEGTLRTVLVSRAVGDDEQRPVNGATLMAAISTLNGSRLFFVPILKWQDLPRWETLGEMSLYTNESRQTQDATGHRWAVRKELVPPIDTKPLYQSIAVPAK